MGRTSKVQQKVYLGDPTDGTTPLITYTTTLAYNDAANSVVTTNPRGNDASDVLNGQKIQGQTKAIADGLGRVDRQIVDFGGLNLTTSYSYDADGNVTSVTDPGQSTVTNLYDGLDRLVKTRDAMGFVDQFTYDGDNNVVTHIDARGILFTAAYDNLNRLSKQTVKETISNGGLPLVLTALTYQDLQNRVIQTDADGNATAVQYDALGRALSVTDPVGNQVVNTYDGVNLRSQTDRNGNKTLYGYDALNRVTTRDEFDRANTLQASTTYRYLDARNQFVQVGPRTLNGQAVETIAQSNSLGRMISLSVQHPSLATQYGTSKVTLVQLRYDGNGNLVLATDADLNQTAYAYDGVDRQVLVTAGVGSPEQATTSYTYDKVGDLVSVKDGRQHAAPTLAFPQDPTNPAPTAFDAYYTYDLNHRQVSTTDGIGETTRFSYDGNNNPVSIVDPNGNVTRYTYDELGALLSVDETANGGGVTRYVYDGNRNKIAQQDASGTLTTFRYDTLNRLTDLFQHFVPGNLGPLNESLTANASRGADPRGGTLSAGGNLASAMHWQYAYDSKGNIRQVTDPKGQIITSTSNFRDRLTGETFAGGDPSVNFQPVSFTFAYDNNDNNDVR